MNWQKVIDDLDAQAMQAVHHANELKKNIPAMSTGGNGAVEERLKTIERHKINGNFCFALAQALKAGLEE